MSDEQEIGFLEADLKNKQATEDIQKAKDPAGEPDDEVKASSGKRQRSIVEMFGMPVKDNKSGPSPKKIRLTSTTAKDASSAVSSPSSTKPSLNAIPFSLSDYVESLSEEQKKLLGLECENMGKSWLKLLKDEIKKPYFIQLKRFLWDAGFRGANDSSSNLRIYPSPKNVYAWSNTPLGKIKVVILGQDPYHGPGQAHGLSFSVPRGFAVPPSLRNIYSEIKSEYPQFVVPKHGNLTSWAENGVLLLNTCLTVNANEAGSHSGKGWENFTDKVLDIVDRYGGANLPSAGVGKVGYGRGVVFLAWGSWAAKRVSKLSKTKHLILKSAHPSPLSANKGFLGNGHFKSANEWLEQKYGAEGRVDWCKLELPEAGPLAG